MQEVWKRIEEWLKNNAPAVFEKLASGASETEIAKTERSLPVQLPEEVKESYRLHNGHPGWFISGGELLSLEGIEQEWTIWKELLDNGDFQDEGGLEGTSSPDAGIQAHWWNDKWIPVTTNGCGDNLCLDMAPAEGGTIGQIITMVHDHESRSLIAPSFRTWLEDFADDLEAGKYIQDETGLHFAP